MITKENNSGRYAVYPMPLAHDSLTFEKKRLFNEDRILHTNNFIHAFKKYSLVMA